jgi:hypothetical protein
MDWVKVYSFDNLYQAEFIKDLLEEQGINAVIVNNRDSMLLIGDIDLYVQKGLEEKANELIEEYYGLTMIDSFIMEKPIRRYQDFIESKGISTVFKDRENPRLGFKSFELFVRNEDTDKVRPYLNADNIDGWKSVAICHREPQIRYRCLMLEDKGIETMVLKIKDASYKLQDIFLLVPDKDALLAKEMLNKLDGWLPVADFEQLHKAEIREDLLTNNGIPVIIKQDGGNFKLYVPEQDKKSAIDLILSQKKWIKLSTYNSLVEAQADQMKLQEAGINAAIVTMKDSMFLIGGYDLYVSDDNVQQALKILGTEE